MFTGDGDVCAIKGDVNRLRNRGFSDEKEILTRGNDNLFGQKHGNYSAARMLRRKLEI